MQAYSTLDPSYPRHNIVRWGLLWERLTCVGGGTNAGELVFSSFRYDRIMWSAKPKRLGPTAQRLRNDYSCLRNSFVGRRNCPTRPDVQGCSHTCMIDQGLSSPWCYFAGQSRQNGEDVAADRWCGSRVLILACCFAFDFLKVSEFRKQPTPVSILSVIWYSYGWTLPGTATGQHPLDSSSHRHILWFPEMAIRGWLIDKSNVG